MKSGVEAFGELGEGVVDDEDSSTMTFGRSVRALCDVLTSAPHLRRSQPVSETRSAGRSTV